MATTTRKPPPPHRPVVDEGFSDRIRERREYLMATQAEVGAAMGGVSGSYVAQLEAGTRNVRLGPRMRKLAKALGMPSEYIRSGKGPAWIKEWPNPYEQEEEEAAS